MEMLNAGCPFQQVVVSCWLVSMKRQTCLWMETILDCISAPKYDQKNCKLLVGIGGKRGGGFIGKVQGRESNY